MTQKETDLEQRCKNLEWIIQQIWWMSRRYAHGRSTYAVEDYNEAIKLAQDLGMKFEPDSDGLIEAKDGMFDKAWFESREINSIKFITSDEDIRFKK